MKLLKFIIFIFIIINICRSIENVFAQEESDSDLENSNSGRLVLLPLPFYAPTTGFGLTLKLIHTNLGKTLFLDLTSFAATQNMQAFFLTIGQKIFLNRFFWNSMIGGNNFNIKFYGIGNDVDPLKEVKFKSQTYFFSPKLGIFLTRFFRIFVSSSHSNNRLKGYDDPKNYYFNLWESLEHKSIVQNKLGLGFDIEQQDSNIFKKKQFAVNYHYQFADNSIFANTYSYSENTFDVKVAVPLFEKFSHASCLKYQSVYKGAPFTRYPKIMVRGIENQRHTNVISVALLNEERFFIADNWLFVPFWDIGKVASSNDDLIKDLHFGYGLGIRYILKESLVVRFDVGFSKGGESSVIFNYGHTF